MTDISVIGLGAMGSAIAAVQRDYDYDVTIWNRTRAKAAPLVAMGMKQADTVGEAVLASPVTMICVDSYAISDALLAEAFEDGDLTGRTIIQFSTGSPHEARRSAEWIAARGGEYLDGSIMCYPSAVGSNDSPMMIGGDPEVYQRVVPHLTILSRDLRYMGESVAATAALDMGLLTTSVALYAGVAHAARMCEAEGVDLLEFARAAKGKHGGRPAEIIEVIARDAFALDSLHPGASLSVWAKVVHRIRDQAASTGIDTSLPDFLASLYDRGIEAGLGEEDVAALVKVMRGTSA
ncbi:NAD(P)-dependent oxidoreductase [Rhodobacteraceae bacterium NNCM2]|nr:NAD(P)-dependent oxidoreductase [Coraliihabitans acroporae]